MKASFRFFLAALATTVTLAGCVQEITPPSFENDKVAPARNSRFRSGVGSYPGKHSVETSSFDRRCPQ